MPSSRYRLYNEDCLDVLLRLQPDSIDSIVCDPPYGLSFMGKDWDHGIPGVEFWTRMLRVAKPGAMLLAFGGTRTHHRLMCAIEDAGWEIKDCIFWIYGSGFPKSHNISKAIDKVGGANFMGWFPSWLEEYRTKAGVSRAALADHFPSRSGGRTGCIWNWEHGIRTPSAKQFNRLCILLNIPAEPIEEVERRVLEERRGYTKTFNVGATDAIKPRDPITAPATEAAKQWDGYGTNLKPAAEVIVLAMKTLDGTFAHNAMEHGVAGLNVDGCRVGTEDTRSPIGKIPNDRGQWGTKEGAIAGSASGRWPANVILSHHSECVQVGVKKVKGHPGYPNGPGGSSCQLTQKGTPTTRTEAWEGYADADGTETVENWECHPDCPVGMLGSAARFFYTAKASKKERNEGLENLPTRPAGGLSGRRDGSLGGEPVVAQNVHPTVKPLALIEYLCKLTMTPTGGKVLDPFMGSGTTGVACMNLGRKFVGIEKDTEHGYFEIAKQRTRHAYKNHP